MIKHSWAIHVGFFPGKDYICQMKLILSNTFKFKKIQNDASKVLIHLTYIKNKTIELLKV